MEKKKSQKWKPTAKISYQPVYARIKPLSSPTTLEFPVFSNAVINDTCFIKLRYLYICVLSKVDIKLTPGYKGFCGKSSLLHFVQD